MADPRVRKISFTGSTRVGKILLRQAADRVVRTSMELGGAAPLIVADDADLDAAVEGALVAKFRNGGQACTAANAIFVHEAVADSFIARFGRRVEQMSVGPADAGHEIGPMISAGAVRHLESRVQQAIDHGATVSHRAQAEGGAGHFFAPVVLTDLEPMADIVTEEIFGPVAPVVTWSDERELVADLNRSEYGLAAYVFSRDTQRAMRIAEALEVGMIGINRGLVSDPAAPFGGMKQSGLGREGGRTGLEEFLETQYLNVSWP